MRAVVPQCSPAPWPHRGPTGMSPTPRCGAGEPRAADGFQLGDPEFQWEASELDGLLEFCSGALKPELFWLSM